MSEINKNASVGQVTVDYRRQPEGARVAIATIDFPPINAGSLVQRTAVLDCFLELARQEDLAGVVLTGAGGNFVGGADIREFDAPAQAPHLPDVIAAIEACPFPVVAAIDGAALGGGFELALGCDARVATRRAVVGLPEVTLGLIPGAGGTLRLSRLVDTVTTISLVTSGRRVKSTEALALGLVDELADADDLLDAAMAYLKSMNGVKRKLRDLPAKISPEEEFSAACREAVLRGRGANAVEEACEAIRKSATIDVDEALALEREVSLRLRREPQSRALRHLFFAEKAAMKMPEGATPRAVSTVGVVGAGRMGQGIVLAFAQRGFAVRLAEKEPEFLQRGLEAIAEAAVALEAKGRISSAAALTGRVIGGAISDMADCDLVVEAVFEDMEIKTALFAALEAVIAEDAVLATNTSYLDIDEMASGCRHPERVAGLHFFNPANVMRLVEVVRAKRTNVHILGTLLALSRKLGKVPVVAGVGDGFIGNRIFAAYRQQCEFLLEEGATPAEVDRAMREFGMPMGPFEVFDLAGLDIAWARRKRLAPGRDPKARYVEIADRLCEMERFGKRAGKGWYDYASGKAEPDPIVEALVIEASRTKGIERQDFSGEEIRHRLIAAMVNEACLLLGEGIAQRPSDVDVVLVHGYGFPKLKGGPLHFAAAQPRAEFLESVVRMADASGHGIEVAPNLASVLKEADAL
ncbi:3-hydroxyacyl-CoA dehydrogenase NAD-binding domain-containing protein [Roseibium sp.]|uniref:3-hydroxyacyl-CoA dehydrogenase NAD-binding domain-containing protein n=1 Tax=Roseibium sp. TaxID=1936156 RepID=UPI003A978E36